MKAIQLGITLFLLLVLNGTNNAQTNLSQGKEVSMSSVDGSFSGEFINDGSTEYNKEAKTGLTKTMLGQYQWIQFDLGSKYEITKVVFHCPESIEKDLNQEVNNDELFIAVGNDPNFKDYDNASSFIEAEYLSCYGLNTSRFGINTTPINRKLEGRYIRVWDKYISGITATEIEIFGKTSSTAAKDAIDSGDAAATLRLIEDGGEVDSKQALKLAIDERDSDLVRAVLDNDKYVPSSVIIYAIEKKASTSMIKSLLTNDAEINTSVVDAAMKSKDDDIINNILTEKSSAFRSSHVDLAFNQGQPRLGMKILSKTELKPSRAVLVSAINQGDELMIGELINTYQAKPDAGMLNTVLRSNNESLTNLLLPKVKPNSESFKIVASNDDYEMYQELTAEHNLPDNKSIEIAIDKGNEKIVKKGLKKGGKATPALDYAIQKKNKQMVDLLLTQKGVDVNNAIDFAVEENDKALFNKIVNELGGDAEQGLVAAIKSKKTSLAIIALETGETSPTKYLAAAVNDGNDELAKAIVDAGGDANAGMLPAVEKDNITLIEYFVIEYNASTKEPILLKLAAGTKKLEIVKILVEKGADANHGMNPAASVGRVDVVTFLLENDADANKGMAPSALAGRDQVLQVLLDHGADANKGIAAAINGNQTKCAIMLLDVGADATLPAYIAKASGKDNLAIVKSLLESGAEVENGLSHAVYYNAVTTLKYLVEQGGNLNDSAYMKTALDQMAIGVIPVIAESGLDMNEKVYTEGYSYLHKMVAFSSNFNFTHILIQAGADVNLLDNGNNSALHYAARRGKDKDYLDVVKTLMEAGADINPKNNNGDTPRKVAKGNKMKKLLKGYGGEK